MKRETLAVPDDRYVNIGQSDAVHAKLRTLGNSLQFVDEHNGWFLHIVTELIDATLTNYCNLRSGLISGNYPLTAWACRNLLELSIIMKWVLISEKNGRSFGDDRLIDGCQIIESLKKLELYYDSHAETKALDEALARMQAAKASENVVGNKFKATRDMAEEVTMTEAFETMNKVTSKYVHPTSWSILAMKGEDNSFPLALGIFFGFGSMSMADLYLTIKDHNEKHGMKPVPNL